MSFRNNIILNADSYKYSQAFQYPPGTEKVYSYIESRGGAWDQVLFFGLQGFIKEYLIKPITKRDIDQAERIITKHGEPFYRDGWEHILNERGGKLPIEIRAVPEGTLIPTKNVLVTIENTDPKCWWLTSFLETCILRAVWYPTTVATNSYQSKKLILEYLERTGDVNLIDFKMQDFGFRGVSSLESGAIGGAAHLVNFKGTDTVAALYWLEDNYHADMAGFSIPASEHSSITSWGRDREVQAYENMIDLFAKPGALFACVSDSYDIFNACHLWGSDPLKKKLLESGATLVVRPDSGNPVDVVLKCLQILESHYGSTVNEKGFRVLNHVRVIQGDGIDHSMIRSILMNMEFHKFSADNVTFGQGGKLLQALDRDTLKFAQKCSTARINGEWVDVYKDPITDPGKTSKRGRVELFLENGSYQSRVGQGNGTAVLRTVFLDGDLMVDDTLEQIRDRSK